MKLIWLRYLVYSLGNCAMKLCIETGFSWDSDDTFCILQSIYCIVNYVLLAVTPIC